MKLLVLIPGIYTGIGTVWFVYLFHAGRVEGDFYEWVLHGLMWPLDLAEWIERKLMRTR